MIKCGGRRPDERRSDDRTMYRRTDGARPRSSTLPRAVRAAAAQRPKQQQLLCLLMWWVFSFGDFSYAAIIHTRAGRQPDQRRIMD